MPEPDGALPDWLASPHLDRVWQLLATRLERTGLRCTGRLQLVDLDRDERHAVGDLLGCPVVNERVVVRLDGLDQRLAARAGAGLVEVVSRALARELADRPLERGRRDALRSKPFDAAAEWLDEHPSTARMPWVPGWLDDLRRDGVLTRDPTGEQTLLGALSVVHAVLDQPHRSLSRTDLAAEVLHDAHALDDGSRVSQLVLRALAARTGAEPPVNAAGRRLLWETFGVCADRVSSTCLVVGLDVVGESALARRLHAAVEAGDPTHLTWWDLERDPLDVAVVRPVLVCENPRVLEAVAERFGSRQPVVCVSGRPNLLVLEVLRRLAARGTPLRYHGDFDWAGIAIANQLVGMSAAPWLMSAQDYRRAPGALALSGPPVEPVWDDELGESMRERGMFVHEEAVLPWLLQSVEDELSG